LTVNMYWADRSDALQVSQKTSEVTIRWNETNRQSNSIDCRDDMMDKDNMLICRKPTNPNYYLAVCRACDMSDQSYSAITVLHLRHNKLSLQGKFKIQRQKSIR